MAWYRSGTVNLTNGSAAVDGVGTAFTANVAVGDMLVAPDNKLYEISSIASNTSLTLTTPFTGTTASGATYFVVPTTSFSRELSTAVQTLLSQYGSAYSSRVVSVAGLTGTITIAQLLTQLKTVDGTGSGLDADLLDGKQASEFATSEQGTKADNALPKSGGTLTGVINVAAGTSTAPSISVADANSGVYRQAEDIVGFSAGGFGTVGITKYGLLSTKVAAELPAGGATLSASTLLNGILTKNGNAATSFTLPLGTSIETALPGILTNQCFEWSVVNTSSVAANTVTLLPHTGHTIVGDAVVLAGKSGAFVTRKIGADTFTTYRMA